MQSADILAQNKQNYEDLYSKQQAFLRYPADWLVRFHNMFLKSRQAPGAKALDYGCGSGNNAVFLMQKGYEVFGVDVAPSFTANLLSENLKLHHLEADRASKFSVISPDATKLPYADDTFDFILSNQVLYYLPTETQLKAVCAELNRVLKPGGIVFFTMMGPQNYYITHHLKAVHGEGRVFDIQITDPKHRLAGVREVILIVRDEDDLKSLFGEFDCVTTGHFEQSMFDMKSNFHWIYAGQKKAK